MTINLSTNQLSTNKIEIYEFGVLLEAGWSKISRSFLQGQPFKHLGVLISGEEKILIQYFISFKDCKEIFPSILTIADAMSWKKDKTIKYLNLLENKNFIRKEKN